MERVAFVLSFVCLTSALPIRVPERQVQTALSPKPPIPHSIRQQPNGLVFLPTPMKTAVTAGVLNGAVATIPARSATTLRPWSAATTAKSARAMAAVAAW